MKLLRKEISGKDGAGWVKLRCEDGEDMWHVYNLVEAGDRVRATTLRKVIKSSATGSTTSSKLRLSLTLSVTRTEFDAETCVLRVTGRNAEQSAHVQMGAFHTLDLEQQRDFTLEKRRWDAVALDRIESAVNPARTAEVAVLVMQPGLAHLCLVKGQMTLLKARVEVTIPKKRAGASASAKAQDRFFEALYAAVERHVAFDVVKVLVVASPGFVASDFVAFLGARAVRHEDRNMLDNRGKILVAKASCGHKRAVEEVLSNPNVLSQLADVHAADEIRVLHEFFAMLRSDAARAFYGFRHVVMANENAAVDKLLITDELFRNRDPRERRKYVDLVESVREQRGEVFIFSSLHVSGEQLGQITGIAAVLRFPLPDLEDVLVEDDSDEETDEAESKGDTSGVLDAETEAGLAALDNGDDEDDDAGDQTATDGDTDAVLSQMREQLGF